jgi:hypothetical protein
MILPPKRIDILKSLRRYPVQYAAQLRDQILPHDKDASLTRGHLRKCVAEELVRKYHPKLVLGVGSVPPVYTLTCKGGSVLATVTGESEFLIKAEVSFASWMSVHHWCSLSSLAKIIDGAFEGKDYAKLTAMHFEHEVVAPEEKDPSKRYLLYTRIDNKVCFVPDMAFEADFRGHRRVCFVEFETGTDAPARVAAKKHKGVAGIVGGKFRKAFPLAQDFKCLAFCPNPNWRDALRKEFKGKPGHEHWLFCSTPQVTTESWLHEPLLYTVDKGPISFLPRPT